MTEGKVLSDVSVNYFQKLANITAATAIIPNFLVFICLLFIDTNNPKLVGTVVHTVNISFIFIGIISLGWSLLWHWYDLKGRRTGRSFPIAKSWHVNMSICRHLLASIILLYAVGKLMGLQLQSSILWRGDELGEMSGYELTWAFFGHSKLYNSFIALGQVTASVLLLFRRTTLLGACMLLPILANIVMIDYSFQIFGPLPLACILLYMCLFLVACSGKRLLALFIAHRPQSEFEYASPRVKSRVASIAGGLAVIFYAVGLNLHSYSSKAPSSVIDGTWYSVKAISNSDTANNYRNFAKLFIADNYVSIRRPYGQGYYTLKLDANTRTGSVTMDPYDDNSAKPIKANYQLIGSDSLIISGSQGNENIEWVLKRKQE